MKSILMMVSGVLCVAGGLLHGSGFWVIHGEIAKAGVTGDLAEVVDLALVFMSMGFLTFGAILITCGLQMRKRNYGGKMFAGWAAGCLTLFSAGALFRLAFTSPSLSFWLVVVVLLSGCLP